MKLLQAVSEYVMVATYLQAEARSSSFGAAVEALRQSMEVDPRSLSAPDYENPFQNAERAWMLGRYRGYGVDEMIFKGFPPSVLWTRAEMDVEELADIRYIPDEGWVRLSAGTRSPAVTARRIETGEAATADRKIEAIAKRIAAGEVLPPLIVVGPSLEQPERGLVVLEGHARLTAYLLVAGEVDRPVPVIAGYSSLIERWPWYQR
jgi:hypothetical protein